MIRTVNKFSMSLSLSASDSPRNTKSESKKVPLSSLHVQQTSTGRPVILAGSSNSEWNNDDKWFSQVRRTAVHPILMCGGLERCAPTIFFAYSIFCLVAGFVYSR